MKRFCYKASIQITVAVTIALAFSILFTSSSVAEVYYAKDEALKLAFPEADRIETKTYVIDQEQKARAEKLAKSKIESSLFTVYTGYKKTELLGYAVIDTHIVRTMHETFMVVLGPNGEQKKVVILAFHEPSEYKASERWLKQFEDRPLSDDLWPGRGIHGIVGSTLTTNAITSGVRRILALYQILVSEGAR